MSKKVEEDLPPLILLEDLGLRYPTPNSKQKKRFGIYKCGFCGTEFKASTYKVTIKHTVSCSVFELVAVEPIYIIFIVKVAL